MNELFKRNTSRSKPIRVTRDTHRRNSWSESDSLFKDKKVEDSETSTDFCDFLILKKIDKAHALGWNVSLKRKKDKSRLHFRPANADIAESTLPKVHALFFSPSKKTLL